MSTVFLIAGYTAHQVDLMRFENGLIKKAVKGLDEMSDKLLLEMIKELTLGGVKQRLAEKKAKQIATIYLTGIIDEIKAQHEQLAYAEIELQRNLLNIGIVESMQLKGASEAAEVIAKAAFDKVKLVPFASGGGVRVSYDGLFSGFSEQVINNQLNVIRAGMIYGQSNQAIQKILIQGIGDNSKQMKSKIESIVRTTTIHTATRARFDNLDNFDDDSDLIVGWRGVSTLDSRTSAICRPLDGILMQESDPRWFQFLPPRHPRCRSTVVPEINREYLKSGTRYGTRDSKLLEDVHEVGSGNVFYDVFQRLDKEKQDEILGPTLGEAFRRLDNPREFAKLTVDHGKLRPLSIETMKEKNNNLAKILKDLADEKK